MEGRMRPYLPELTIRDYNTYLWYLRGVRWQMRRSYGSTPVGCCNTTVCCSRFWRTVWPAGQPPASTSACPVHSATGR